MGAAAVSEHKTDELPAITDVVRITLPEAVRLVTMPALVASLRNIEEMKPRRIELDLSYLRWISDGAQYLLTSLALGLCDRGIEVVYVKSDPQ
jgi:hypothetical protein